MCVGGNSEGRRGSLLLIPATPLCSDTSTSTVRVLIKKTVSTGKKKKKASLVTDTERSYHIEHRKVYV